MIAGTAERLAWRWIADFCWAVTEFIDGLGYMDGLGMDSKWRNRAMYAEANRSYLDVKDHGTMDQFLDVILE